MDCPSATERLTIGVPAAFEVLHQPAGSSSTPAGASARAAAEAAQSYITFLDALRLSYKAKDTLHPLLSDVITSVNAVTMRDFEGRSKIVEWLIKLHGMKATDEISDGELRELSFDIEQSYEGFKATL
jgi:ESCRT-I complex subunit VPS28